MRTAISLPGRALAFSLVAGLCCTCLEPLALAQELSPAPGLSGPVGPAPDVGARVHDGFYSRIAAGWAAYDERFQSGDLPLGGSIDGRNRGIASVSDIAIGGTVAPGWVIGGGIFTADVLASTLRVRGDGLATVPDELDPGLRSVSVFAPFVDYYPNVRGGFHVRGALGFATLTPQVFGHPATQRSKYIALGGALMLGVGYDWWVADEWSIGIMSQAGIRLMTGKDDDDVRWTHLTTTSPGLYVCLTYH